MMFQQIRKRKKNLAIISCLSTSIAFSFSQEKPNFVWYMAEDVSPHFFALYNHGKGAQTPNLEKLAKEGIVFQNAYSNAPVSSAARSTLITGCYAPKLGISYHRKLTAVPLPKDLQMFPSYLREVGYFTANAAKTDYNCKLDKKAWNILHGKLGDWRKRSTKKQPFFFVRTNARCHESCLQWKKEKLRNYHPKHLVQEVNLLPQHPDTKLFRYTYASLYDRIYEVDKEFGKMIQMLQQDNVLDNTFIFYFGDNGGSLPGSKGYTTETGLKVPLVVYVPLKWRNKLGIKIPNSCNGFVSFMDFGPTLLHLAGIKIPKQMDGTPFLGKNISKKKLEQRDLVFGYGDRFDELYAFNRTVRKGNYKYSRNFTPYHPKSLYSKYRYNQLAFQEWKTLYKQGRLNTIQKSFFLPQGAEELYDIVNDPYETTNLAQNKKFKRTIEKLRKILFKQMKNTHDLGIIPEAIFLKEGKNAPFNYGIKSANRIKELISIANYQFTSYQKVTKKIQEALSSDDVCKRYWAITDCIYWGKSANKTVPTMKLILKEDSSLLVQSKAVVFLASLQEINPELEMIKLLKKAKDEATLLAILNDMTYLSETFPAYRWRLSLKDIAIKSINTKWRINYLNSLNKNR